MQAQSSQKIVPGTFFVRRIGRIQVSRAIIALTLSVLVLPCLHSRAWADQILNVTCNTTARWPGYAGTQYLVTLDLDARTVNETQVYPNGSHTILRPGDITFVSAGTIAGHLDSGIFPNDGLQDAFSLNRYTGVLTLQVIPGIPPHPHTFICKSGQRRF